MNVCGVGVRPTARQWRPTQRAAGEEILAENPSQTLEIAELVPAPGPLSSEVGRSLRASRPPRRHHLWPSAAPAVSAAATAEPAALLPCILHTRHACNGVHDHRLPHVTCTRAASCNALGLARNVLRVSASNCRVAAPFRKIMSAQKRRNRLIATRFGPKFFFYAKTKKYRI